MSLPSSTLTDRDREILAWRYPSKPGQMVPTQEQLARHYGISRTRVYQHERRALQKLLRKAGGSKREAARLLREEVRSIPPPDPSILPSPPRVAPRTKGWTHRKAKVAP